MALTQRSQVKIWSIVAVVFLALMWLLGDVILPFVLGAAIAYLLDPLADWLEARGLSRATSVSIITLVSVMIFVLSILLVIPTLAQQTTRLFATVPTLFQDLQSFLTERFPTLAESDSTIRQSLSSLGNVISSKGAAFLEGVMGSVSSLFSVVMLLVVVPVVAFYLLLDWDNMVARVDELLPRDHAPVIRRLAGEIDRTLAGFIRGQGTVCLLLGIYYCIGLVLVGLDFGIVVGALAGLLTFIPYIGALVGGALAIGLALFQFWGEWTMIAIVAAIFFSGQFLEGNVLTPKLVGSSVGLHPVWLLLALSVFGSLFGFVGMLVAVPVAAAIGVIVRFAIEQYKHGRLYQGVAGRQPDTVDPEDQ
ncbi:AI-2E family transporter [Tropicimonas sediminicola]|uniref:Predicted PurR-regulated permease PerM n=1 Tax=Tropicimonas sediminicola TaxID=1031541 RepID=A0A239KLW5_9RHOB|nr:AI-2E family transporter [Tropicimonas sediminicola]SNT19055.1 Predicted PurR-regulated permease PerM [Tropicimonas sediminicola]